MNETESEAWQRYMRASHAMQSGVAFEQYHNPPNDIHKDLRVGVNAAMVANEGLVVLLIEKGLFTLAEYAIEQANAMEREVERYHDRARERGYNITFG